jgi:hypothetical protein
MIIPFDIPADIPASVQQYHPQYHDSNSPAAWGNTPKWIRELGMCIRRHESHHNYRAKNGEGSTASGAYQFLNGTWLGNAKWVVQAVKYPTAKSAPAWVQDLVFVHSIKHGGIHNWDGTHCGAAR